VRLDFLERRRDNAGTLHFAHMPRFALVDLPAKVVQFYDFDDDGPRDALGNAADPVDGLFVINSQIGVFVVPMLHTFGSFNLGSMLGGSSKYGFPLKEQVSC
jgi:hypothetical protein